MSKKIFLSNLVLLPIITSSLATVTTINTYNKVNRVKSLSTNLSTKIDWKEVNNNLQNIFSNFKKYEKEHKVFDSKLENIKKITNKIIEDAITNNYNLDQLVNKISLDYPKFVEERNKFYSYSYNKNFNVEQLKLDNLKDRSRLFFSEIELNKLKKLVRDLKISRTTFTTISATAAVAAAGFFAIAPATFGATIAWGTACSIVSAVAGGINIALVKYDQELDKWTKAEKSITSIYTLGNIFYRILKPLLISVNVAAGASVWAFPAAASIIPIVSAILAWIEMYK